MHDKQEYCDNCKWFEEQKISEDIKVGRCGLYGYSLEYTRIGYERLNRCKSAERIIQHPKTPH